MKLYVPVYKTEAGVHSQFPPVAEFNTLATVSGKKVAKDAVEVMLKWIVNAWVEQAAWSAGVVFATKTYNPATSQTAYLYIPISNYNAVAQCCSSSDGTPALMGFGGGTLGAGTGRVAWDSGEAVAVGDEFEHTLVVTMQNMSSLAPLAIKYQLGMQIDWGNGTIYTYGLSDVIVVKPFADEEDAIITIYHNDTINNISITDDAGGFRGTMVSAVGDFPSQLETLLLANGLDNVPVGITNIVRNVNLNNTALSAAELNTVLDLLIGGLGVNGHLSILTNPRQDADAAKIQTLISRGWEVKAYGIYPNL